MFVTISYVPCTGENRSLFVCIFKLSLSDSNNCYDTLRSTFKWKYAFKLRKFMQAPPVSAINSADLCFHATSVYTSTQL